MAQSYGELLQHGDTAAMQASRWLIEHLLAAERTDRALRTIRYQMHTARFPVHRDLASFDFGAAKVNEATIQQLATLAFTGAAHNVVMIGGTGAGKTHLATGLGVSVIQQHGKRVRFYSTVELVNALELENAAGKQGRLAYSLMRMDRVILDELGYLPFSQAGGALLDRLTHHCHIEETGNDSCRFRHSSTAAKTKIKAREQAKKSPQAPTENTEIDEPF